MQDRDELTLVPPITRQLSICGGVGVTAGTVAGDVAVGGGMIGALAVGAFVGFVALVGAAVFTGTTSGCTVVDGTAGTSCSCGCAIESRAAIARSRPNALSAPSTCSSVFLSPRQATHSVSPQVSSTEVASDDF